MTTAKKLAQIACSVTKTHLYEPKRDWIQHKLPNIQFSVAVGTGKATYHKLNRQTAKCKINYGVKAMESAITLNGCMSWTTGSEILDRNYWGRDITPSILLSSTILHEFGHLIQRLHTETRDGVHDALFYKILDRMHASEYRDSVLTQVELGMAKRGIPNQFTNGIREIPESLLDQWRRLRTRSEGYFYHEGTLTRCKVQKVNSKRVNISSKLGGFLIPRTHFIPREYVTLYDSSEFSC